MRNAAGTHWASMAETTSLHGIRLLCWVHAHFGRWPFRLCTWPVVVFQWLLNPVARRASLEYLRQRHRYFDLPGPAPGPIRSLQHFFRFAETLLDKVLAVSGRYPFEHIQMQRESMLAQLRSQCGGILVTAHIGCLELCCALAPKVPGLRMIVLVHTAHAERFNRLLRELSPQPAVELVQVTQLDAAVAMRLSEAVAAGAFVAIAADRVPVHGGRHVSVPFLGRDAAFPIGPYVLASTLGCPLFAMACTRAGPGYRIDFDVLSGCVRLQRATRKADLQREARTFAQWLETRLQQAELDWFNFFPFWDQAGHDANES